MQPSSIDRFFQSRRMDGQVRGDLLGSIVARSQAVLHKATSLERLDFLQRFYCQTFASTETIDLRLVVCCEAWLCLAVSNLCRVGLRLRLFLRRQTNGPRP